MRTLRARVTATAAAVAAAGLLAAGWSTPRLVDAALTQRLTADATDAAWALLDHDSGAVLPLSASGRLLQLRNPAGDVVAASAGAVRASSAELELISDVEAVGGTGQEWVTGQDDLRRLDEAWQVVTVTRPGPGGTWSATAATPLADVYGTVQALQGTVLVAVPLLVLAVAAAVWWAVGALLRPVEQVHAQARQLAAAPSPSPLPVPRTGQEIADLVGTFNDVLSRLAASRQRQQRFVADASHELLNPLAAIRTQLEVALRRSDPNWPAVAQRCLATERRLSDVAQDLLLMARSEADTRLEGRREVSLDRLVQDEAAELGPVVVDLPEAHTGPVMVLGQRSDLSRLLHNLLANARRHGNSPPAVRLTRENAQAVLRVDDDGPGVPEHERNRVFEPFVRLDEGRARSEGGAGLGLAIVARIAHQHRGSVRIGDSPSGGARIEVRLPLAPLSRSANRHKNWRGLAIRYDEGRPGLWGGGVSSEPSSPRSGDAP